MQRTVAGRFEIEAHARSGGMAEVFVARDLESGERVALKLLQSTTAGVTERFLREAQILAEIDHPAIVGHVAHGIDVDLPYLVMRWVPGKSLSEQLAGAATLGIPETVALTRRIAEALAIVHGRGIVHRDVKPSNIVVERGDLTRPVLLDFGIAHVAGAMHELTHTGELLGTPGYLAPEQAQGAEVSAATDIFALGCVVFRCLTGRSPFEARDPLSAAVKVLLEDAPRLRDRVANIPRDLDELVASMLARDPRRRPRDAEDVLAALSGPHDQPTLHDRTVRRPSASPSARTLGGGERRVISLVIARRPGWEPTMSAIEAVREILDERLEPLRMRATVLADGSIVAAAHDDAPHDAVLRAARAALLIANELDDARVVLATGRAVMEEDVPVGETVDRAIALLDRDSDGIVVDAASSGLLASRFAIDERSEEGGTLRILVGESRAARTLLGKPSPLVGRTRELVTLEAMLDECETESVARAMLVTAGPGVGKSRLCSELTARASSRGVRTWTAWGDPATKGSPLAMLRGLLEVAAETEKLTEILAEVVSPVAAPSPELVAARRDRLFFSTRLRAAWCTFVVAACRKGPLAIVLEDLHWGDSRTIDLVDAALVAARELPLFVVAFARPEVERTFSGLFAAHGVQHLKLLGLTARASAELVREALGDRATEATTNALVAHAAGNALFLEELIRATAEGRTDTPETLVAMMEQRLALLDAEARRVLRAAAIFGETAPLEGIQELVGGDRAAFTDVCTRLATAELLVPTDDGHAFRHALLREAAYATLTDEDRRLGHRVAGEWLEKRGADAVVLADHFLIAGDRDRARDYFFRAATAALASNDLEASLALAARVESLDPTPDTLAGVRMLQTEANLWKDNPAALAQGLELLALAEKRSAIWYRGAAGLLFVAGQVADFSTIVAVVGQLEADDSVPDDDEAASMQVMAYSMTAWLLAMVGIHERARTFLTRAAAREAQADENALGWLGIARFYSAKYITGDPALALAASRSSRERFTRLGDVRLTVLSQMLEAASLTELGAYEDAMTVLDSAQATCDLADLSAARGDAKRWKGHVLEALGQLDEALALQEAAYAEINTLAYRGAAKAGAASVLLAKGAIDEARRRAAEAANELTFAPSQCAHALAVLAKAEVRAGNLDAALEAAKKGDGIVDAFGCVANGEAPVYVALAEVHEARGERDEALAAVTKGAAFVRRRAAKIDDPVLRRSFEERVAENAWLLRRTSS